MAIEDRRGVVVLGTDPAIAGDPNATLAIKAPVQAATTANITLSGLQTIDGYALAEADRVLVKNQDDATQNGIYDASSGIWQRSADADSNSEWGPGVIVYALNGTLSEGKGFQLGNTSPIVLGTTSIVWSALPVPLAGLSYVIDGGGVVIEIGARAPVEFPFACTIADISVCGDTTGSIEVDLLKTSYANLPADSGDSICGGEPIVLSAAQKTTFSAPAAWTKTIETGEWITPVVNSVSSFKRVTISLRVTRG